MFKTVLWIYIALLLIGGLMGFIKAKSRISLITSGISAALLALVAFGEIKYPYAAHIIVGVLVAVFAARFIRTKKIMPAAMMTVLSAIVLILLFVAKS
jgi:uncharacterized membrane protein (UPF0136 family)